MRRFQNIFLWGVCCVLTGAMVLGGQPPSPCCIHLLAQQRGKERLFSLQDRAAAEKDRQREQRTRESASNERSYQRARRALDDRQWEQAIEGFSEIARRGGQRADAALYWKAYAQNKRGQRDEALTTVEDLRKSFPSSRWLNDAKALEVELRQAAGRPVSPETETDEELKLMAINSLVNSDPDRVIPLLEKLLQGSHSPRLKERALFVLGQSGSPRAREIVAQTARGGSNPDLQMRALRYLGVMPGKENRQVLAEIYASSSDLEVKRAILHSFMTAGDRERLFAAAKDEKIEEARREAIHQLGLLRAESELGQLYGLESNVEVKRRILHSLFLAGSARALVDIARRESDLVLKKEAVRNISLMKSKEATDYMLEILNK